MLLTKADLLNKVLEIDPNAFPNYHYIIINGVRPIIDNSGKVIKFEDIPVTGVLCNVNWR